MKLVTGIEAIQSGKPFRRRYLEIGNPISFGDWIHPDGTGTFTIGSLFEKIWEIKEEPREFWIDISKPNFMYAYPSTFTGADVINNNNWIRVREVEK